MTARIILHGKQAANEDLRSAVSTIRDEGFDVDVRVTWQGGDAGVLAGEASEVAIERVIAGGGDGTVNEVLQGLRGAGFVGVMGILPLGTANDFARSAGIDDNLVEALRVAVSAQPCSVDVGRAGDRVFLNMATGGFGTEITVSTDPRLKKHLGGAAYLLTGISRFGSIRPAQCTIRVPDGQWEGELLVLAVGNGRQAGGGQVMCPQAVVDDGLLDVAVLPVPPKKPANEAISLLMSKGLAALEDTVVRWRVPWIEVDAADGLHVNLDGEPVHATSHRFEVESGGLRLALPDDSPLRGA